MSSTISPRAASAEAKRAARLTQEPARNLLVELRQLSGDYGFPFAENFARVLERGRDPMRAFVKNQSGRQRTQLTEPRAACARPRRQKTAKKNSSVGRPDATRALINALAPGTGTTRTPSSIARRASRKPGSLMLGVPASETTATSEPCFELFEKFGGALAFVVFVIADGPGVYAVVAEQLLRVARVLTGDHALPRQATSVRGALCLRDCRSEWPPGRAFLPCGYSVIKTGHAKASPNFCKQDEAVLL
mgnify:CR=1 FL=1